MKANYLTTPSATGPNFFDTKDEAIDSAASNIKSGRDPYSNGPINKMYIYKLISVIECERPPIKETEVKD